MLNDRIESSPAEFVPAPKFGRQLPDVLTTDEIDRIVAAADAPTTKGLRDSAMLETLYSCGLRVSELTSLRMQDLFFGEGYIRVTGKGDKQRLVPISAAARDRIQLYLSAAPRTGERRSSEQPRRAAGAVTDLSRSEGGSPAGGESTSGSRPPRSATRSPRTCSKGAPASGRCRRCWGTKAS